MALYTTKNTNREKGVGDPTASYDSLKPLWKKSRAVLNGQAHAKSYDAVLDSFSFQNLLIPFSQSMSAEQYEFFKSEAELPGLTSQYAKTLVGGLLRKDVQLTLPDGLPEDADNWIRNNFTAEDKNISQFLDEALWEELQTSRAWVYVDHPYVPENAKLTADQRKQISPYPVLTKAENVINWRTGKHPMTGKMGLIRFIVRYLEEDFSENQWHPNYVDTVVDHYLDESGFLVVDKYQKTDATRTLQVINGEVTQEYFSEHSETQFTLIDTNIPLMQGERITEIPAWPLNGQIEPIEPLLMPLVDREIGLYNKVSRRNHLLYGASTYTPVVASDMTDEEFVEIVNAGLGSWLHVRQGDEITALETPTAALKDMEQAIINTVEEMAKMGIRLLSPEGGQSGVALEIRNAPQTAQLGSLNSKVSATMEKVITFMLNWKYGLDLSSDDVDFSLSQDFAPVAGGDQAMRLVTEWYQGGIISRDTFVSIAKFNDYLPSDYNDEEAVNVIMTDPLIRSPEDKWNDENQKIDNGK